MQASSVAGRRPERYAQFAGLHQWGVDVGAPLFSPGKQYLQHSPQTSETMTGQPATHGSTSPRLLLIAGYTLALVLVFMPILETFAALWPPQPGNTGWRFGATGVFFTFLSMAPLGLLVAIAIASIQRHRIALRALATFSILLAVVIAVLFGSFSLDFIQVRPMIQPRVKGGFDAAAAKATVTAILSLVACMILALAGFRDSRELATIRRPRRAPAEDVVIGRGKR